MNNKKFLTFQIFSIIFTAILGTLLHFTYEWSNSNPIIASFSAINESVWEHLKLLFFPMLITTIIGYFYLRKEFPNFICAKTIGIIISLLFIITFFYTYTGLVGTNIAILNIFSFFIAIIIGEFFTYKFTLSLSSCNPKICIIILIIFFLCFIIFTYKTPQLEIFKFPISKQLRP